jgi:hypothetical protein
VVSKAHETGIALITHAMEFHTAAELLLSSVIPMRQGVLLPFLFVVHHSIELYLKVFLCLQPTAKGVWGHDIVQLFDRSVELGLTPSAPEARENMVMLSVANHKHNLRYLDMGKSMRLPTALDTFVDLLNALRSDVEPFLDRAIKAADPDYLSKRAELLPLLAARARSAGPR